MGPLLLVQAGIPLVDLPDDALFERGQGRRPRSSCAAPRCGSRGERAGARRLAGPARRARRDRATAPGHRRRARGLRAQHRRAHGRGAGPAVRQDRAAALRHRLPRPARRSIVVRGVDHQADLQGAAARSSATCGPALVGVDGGANAILEAGLRARHDRRRHGLGVRGDAALRRRARRARLRRRPRARPRPARAARAARTRSCRRRGRARTSRC